DDERIGVQTPCVNRHYAARGVMGRYSGSTLYPVQLESDRLISAKPAPVDEFEQGRTQLYRNAKREGVRV
ncbi:hypothetical protein JW916_15670, partial [Candidatus Sumerlaeota bacterium]|nr:hypothetical protein [Candidatus Sumerlaeota bacterium]